MSAEFLSKISKEVKIDIDRVKLTYETCPLEVLKISIFGLKGGISIVAEGLLITYVLCDSICHQLFTFIQIGSGHTVIPMIHSLLTNLIFLSLDFLISTQKIEKKDQWSSFSNFVCFSECPNF